MKKRKGIDRFGRMNNIRCHDENRSSPNPWSKDQDGDFCLASLNGLKKQLEKDLERTDLNFIIGRLSASSFYRRRDKKRVENPHWEGIRKAQQAFADASERAVCIDTNDLNGEKNELHLIKPEGYETLGKRYMEAAVKLVVLDDPR